MGAAKVLAGVVALLLFAGPVCAQAADEALPMAPSTPWVVDYADDSCVLSRTFEGGGKDARLELRQFCHGDSFEVTFSSNTLRPTRRGARVRFEPDEDLIEMTGANYFDEGDRNRVRFYGSLKPNALQRRRPVPKWSSDEREAREKAVSGFTMTGRFEPSVTLQTGELHRPLEAMRACLDELMTHWGLDAAVQRTLSRQATPINLDDWGGRIAPNYAARVNRPPRPRMTAVLRLIVGTDGKVVSCVVNKDSVDPVLDNLACAIALRYALFELALDADGEPTASRFSTSIVFNAS